MKSELDERAWAVVSERGCEASALTYEQAVELVARLVTEGVYGLCIVTKEAAARIGSASDHRGED
ncbi:MAG: hypothetical protein C4334_05195 [Pyrinomonas sp.]|uniref:hypothetical protein n=1 Tax=Pyrinomonas sp. TaxID=2080306 RepID=UPI00331994E3